MKNRILLIFLALFYTQLIFGQNISNNYNLGVGSKLTIEILYNKQSKIWFNWRLAMSFNSSYLLSDTYLPTFNIDWVLMQGGIGTNDVDFVRQKKFFQSPVQHFLAFTFHPLQFGKISNDNHTFIGKPLYYFSDFTYPILINPFKGSISMGTSLIWNFHERKLQRVGVLNISYVNFQILYANDGGSDITTLFGLLGDKEDRWFTGTTILNYYHNKYNFNSIEISYHKFTGWAKNSFDVSCDLGLTETSYNDSKQNKYNTSLLSLKVLCTPNIINNHGILGGFGINFYDVHTLDFQHKIHLNKYYSYHASPNPTKIGIALYGQLQNFK